METNDKFKNSPIHDKVAILELMDEMSPSQMVKTVDFMQQVVKNCDTPLVSKSVEPVGEDTVCNCKNVETTDIGLGEDRRYYHVLCKKPITN